MSIVNRRNAIFGWLAWMAAKQMAKRKAMRQVSGDRSRVGMSAALAAATATAVGALLFWRRRRDRSSADES
jgi:hypothetical protein